MRPVGSDPSEAEIGPADLDLSRFIRPGDGVLWGQGAGEPIPLTSALAAQSEQLGPVEAFCGLLLGDHLATARPDMLRLRSYGVLGAPPQLPIDVVPCHLSAIPALLRDGLVRADVVLIQVPPADEEGFHSLGVSVDYLADAVRVARVVLAEVNDQCPVTAGPVRIHRSRLAATVHTSRPLVTLPAPRAGEVERRIADRVAGLVPDGATIELGIGGLASAVGAALTGHRELRVHTGLIGDWLVDLAERGSLTRGPGAVAVGCTALGTERLYRWIDRNPAVELRPVTLTHGIAELARLPGYVAVNSALEVDLTGQVNAETVGGRYVGGIGGQVDFLRGAAASTGGLAVVALPSTARRGTRSRVVAALDGPVTSARADVDVVVTEHGVADLRGRSLRERTAAMLRVADPAFRDELAATVGATVLDSPPALADPPPGHLAGEHVAQNLGGPATDPHAADVPEVPLHREAP